ncbi:glycosyltransferase family 2 protein [Mesonia ostreae]|uniref:Galactosyltransferase-related protein n=1 Tax=Mesonia ostreae TaxID=861110 RepID=A0ABU2KEA0_9FLAO|nr:galactosyltransferase-related protein [Mesonia ostreae]MDT0293028.1 galactosyltransferase-related protein [Mesonia ostreae]
MRNRGISLIVIFHKRLKHLRQVLKGVENGTMIPDEIILVEMDIKKSFIPESLLDIKHYLLPTTETSSLTIAEARNLGAYWSTKDILAFLDVDCIPSADYMKSIENLQIQDDCLYMGLPKYLSEKVKTVDEYKLKSKSEIHPHRPEQNSVRQIDDYGMFWSLTFFLTHKTFSKIDGFDINYTGYGAEDTDFAFNAESLGIKFILTPFEVYHQQHSFYRPPLNSMNSIIKNCNYFYSKWKHWPMINHLQKFAERGLVIWNEDRTEPIEILKQPTILEIEATLVVDEPYS